MFGFLSQKFHSLLDSIKGKPRLQSEDLNSFLSHMRSNLVDADVALDVVDSFLSHLKDKCSDVELGKKVTAEEFLTKQIYDTLIHFLGGNQASKDIFEELQKVSGQKIILVAGLQGAGKTTTIGKLVRHVCQINNKRNAFAKKILVVSLDYQRPAARDQLRIIAERLLVDFFETPANTVEQALDGLLKHLSLSSYEYVFVDTAGRLHVETDSLEQIKYISSNLSPCHTFLVLDGMMGQAALRVTKEFNKYINIDSAILTKLDSDTRGGVALSFAYSTGKPISYIGSGEKSDDLEYFKPVAIARLLLGMGDIDSLIEKINKKFAAEEQEQIEAAVKRGDLTIDGYVRIFDMIEKMGTFKQILSMMPRSLMQGQSISDDKIEQIEKRIKMFRAMRDSMTARERQYPAILTASRLKRVAKGCGIHFEIVRQLMQEYHRQKEQMKVLAKFL